MGRLEKKVAFITGAGAGIARAIALAAAREGAAVALAEIDAQAGRRTESDVKAQGGDAHFVATDVTRDESVAQAIATTVERYGKLDVLVNCAGGSLQEDVPVHEMDLDVWHRTIALNLLHPFLCCRHGIPHMIKAGGGAIVNFSSHLGMTGSQKPAYAAAKGGIVAFTRTLAAQYAQHGIRANAIAPGMVRSERSIKRWESVPADSPLRRTPAFLAQEALRSLYPFSVGEPEHVAALAVFLAADESRMLTGVTIAADGGKSEYLKVLAAG